MSRAAWLASAQQYLFEAMNGLSGASRALDESQFPDSAESARDLHKGAEALHFEIGIAATLAHRAEHPEFYDDDGQWVGRQDRKEKP